MCGRTGGDRGLKVEGLWGSCRHTEYIRTPSVSLVYFRGRRARVLEQICNFHALVLSFSWLGIRARCWSTLCLRGDHRASLIGLWWDTGLRKIQDSEQPLAEGLCNRHELLQLLCARNLTATILVPPSILIYEMRIRLEGCMSTTRFMAKRPHVLCLGPGLTPGTQELEAISKAVSWK